MKKYFKSKYKYIAQKSFIDGHDRCKNQSKKLILKRSIDKFLDIGCGNGAITIEFSEILKPNEIYGIEFVDSFRFEAEKKGIKCFKCDLNGKWNFDDNFFDFILSSQNIEHLHNTRIYLEECYRCLKPGGQLMILTENLCSWVNIGALVFGWQPFSTTNINGWSLGNPLMSNIDEPKDEEFSKKWQDTGVSGTVGHVRVLAYGGLVDLLKKIGLKDIKVYTRGYLPIWGNVSDLLCSVDNRHGHFILATGLK